MSSIASSSPNRKHLVSAMRELTYLSHQWQPKEDPPLYAAWMASSEVDQKFLGHFAKTTTADNNYLSSFLFKVLGLSIILAEKLLKARRAKQLDPTRDAKARHLIHHILWLAREGLIMVEQYVLPMVGNYVELKVLSYKLRASFLHIFVLFHNDPAVNDRIVRHASATSISLFPEPLSPKLAKTPENIKTPTGTRQRSPAISVGVGGPVGATRTPPGLPYPSSNYYYNPRSASTYGGGGGGGVSSIATSDKHTTDSATFLLPLEDYTPQATAAFKEANALADRLLPGSHPVRLSVKVEYVAYMYDCLHDADRSRQLAKMSIRHVYEAQEGMDDESFEDATEMVSILGRMMKRGLGSTGGSSGSQQAHAPAQHRGSAGTAGAGAAAGNGSASPTRARRPSQSSSRSSRPSRPTSRSASGGGGGGGAARSRKEQAMNWV